MQPHLVEGVLALRQVGREDCTHVLLDQDAVAAGLEPSVVVLGRPLDALVGCVVLFMLANYQRAEAG